MKDFIKTAIYLLFVFGIHFTAHAAKCPDTLEKLLKEAQMNKDIFPVESVHRRLLKTASIIENGTLLHIKMVPPENQEKIWEYAFKFSSNGPALRLWVGEKYFLTTFISSTNKNNKSFSLTSYIRHISNSSTEAYKISTFYKDGQITKEEMLELELKQIEGFLNGELGESLRGEKWVDIPDYTYEGYR